MNWWKNLKGKVRLREPLKNHTTFKIGGPAKFFVEPKDPDDLKSLLILAKKYKFPLFVMGGGSNLLINDAGINGVVIKLNAPYFNKISYKGNYLSAGAGVWLNKVVSSAGKRGLSGAEFLAGIPGTIGGALAMNAGIAKDNCSIQKLVEKVTVMDYNGNIKVLNKKDLKFGYRESGLSKYIILSALLRLNRKSKKQIGDAIKAYLEYRRLTQDLSKPSAGCVFRNPQGNSAGRLIDLCGLKGKKIGGAGVSRKHANFIVNLGNGSASDVLKLAVFIRKKVKNKFNINLTPEIKIWQN